LEKSLLSLRDVDRKTKPDPSCNSVSGVAHPGHGQIGRQDLVLLEQTPQEPATHSRQQMPVFNDHTLGLSRRPRAVQKGHAVVRGTATNEVLLKARFPFQTLFAIGSKFSIRNQTGVAVSGDPSRIFVNDYSWTTCMLPQIKDLVHLFLILCQGVASKAVFLHMEDLPRNGIRENRRR